VVRDLVPVVAVAPAPADLVLVPAVVSADRAVVAVAELVVAADSRPVAVPVAVGPVAHLAARARLVAVVPAAALVAVPVVVRVDSAVGDDRADPRNGGGRSVVATAPSSSRLRSGSRRPMHPSPKAKLLSRAAAPFRSTRPS
jgi:hypothetical protein